MHLRSQFFYDGVFVPETRYVGQNELDQSAFLACHQPQPTQHQRTHELHLRQLDHLLFGREELDVLVHLFFLHFLHHRLFAHPNLIFLLRNYVIQHCLQLLTWLGLHVLKEEIHLVSSLIKCVVVRELNRHLVDFLLGEELNVSAAVHLHVLVADLGSHYVHQFFEQSPFGLLEQALVAPQHVDQHLGCLDVHAQLAHLLRHRQRLQVFVHPQVLLSLQELQSFLVLVPPVVQIQTQMQIVPVHNEFGPIDDFLKQELCHIQNVRIAWWICLRTQYHGL